MVVNMAVRSGNLVIGLLLCFCCTLPEGTQVGFERSRREAGLHDRLGSIIFRVQTLESHVRRGDRTILKQASDIAELRRELRSLKRENGLPRETGSSATASSEILKRELRHLRQGLSNEKNRRTNVENSVQKIKESFLAEIAELRNDIKEGNQRLNRTLIELVQNTTTGAGKKGDEFSCPVGFVRNGRSCYWINEHMSVRTYSEGVRTCNEKQASLVSLETVEEQQFLIGKLKTMGRLEWLTSGRKVNGVWTWEGTGETIKTTDGAILWGMGEPHNTFWEPCMSFWMGYGYRLADVACSGGSRAFICERSATMGI